MGALLLSIAKKVLTRFGFFLMLAGLVPLGLQIYNHYQTKGATAQVVGIDAYCRLKSCPKCRHLRSTCRAAETNTALATGLSVRKYVRLSYATHEGRPITAKARFSRLELTDPQIGDTMLIRYNTRRPAVVSPAQATRLSSIGLIVACVGLGMLALRLMLGNFGRGPSTASPLPSPGAIAAGLRRARRRQESDDARTQSISPAWGEPGDRPVKPVVPVVRSTPKVAVATRRHPQGRNRGLFGRG